MNCCAQILVLRAFDIRKGIYDFERKRIEGEMMVAKFALKHTAKQGRYGRQMVRSEIKKWIAYYSNKQSGKGGAA